MSDERDAFVAEFDVPRETSAKFDRYEALLIEWQERMNLVGPSTIPEIWSRHFADSAQLMRLAGPGAWLDIGAGAGFPGLVVALLGAGPVHLVESVGKKARFLEHVAEELALSQVSVHSCRVENLPAFQVATITARACAPLEKLFDWGLRFAGPATQWLLPKGSSVETELQAARFAFRFEAERIPSLTNADARIVHAFHVKRR